MSKIGDSTCGASSDFEEASRGVGMVDRYAVQIAGYVDDATWEESVAYAYEMGLDAATLARVLILRELRLRRLGTLFRGIRRPLEKRHRKITAHVRSDLKAALCLHTATLGLSLSEAMSLLWRAELEERWLDRSLTQNESAPTLWLRGSDSLGARPASARSERLAGKGSNDGRGS